MLKKKSMEALSKLLKKFVKEKDWDQFHSPKNLAMALIVETAELAEHFQWITQAESFNLSQDEKKKIAEEVGDILIYLTRFADIMEVDLLESGFKRIKQYESNYPRKP
ncbi:MAG: nucleotide pyrophosphohydrolase [Pseudomonadota bacterium]